jgi:invasion protein IalB
MRLHLLAAAFSIAAMSVAFPAAAQETPAEPARPAAPEAPAAPAAPASPQAQPPAQTGDPAQSEIRIKLRETHGDWELRCAPDESECFMYQLARDQNGNPVAEINIVRLEEGSPAEAGVTVLTPLGTLLRPGLTLAVDDGERRSFPFLWCDASGCFSRFALGTEEVDALRQGTSARLTVFSVGAPQTPVDLSVSLVGFTAAISALEPIQN